MTSSLGVKRERHVKIIYIIYSTHYISANWVAALRELSALVTALNADAKRAREGHKGAFGDLEVCSTRLLREGPRLSAVTM